MLLSPRRLRSHAICQRDELSLGHLAVCLSLGRTTTTLTRCDSKTSVIEGTYAANCKAFTRQTDEVIVHIAHVNVTDLHRLLPQSQLYQEP